jgi:hypothetical protein
MKLSQRLAVFLGALTLALGIGVVAASPAQAHPYDGCGWYHFCIQTTANQSGWTSYSWNLSTYQDNACVNIEGVHNNTAKAVFNRNDYRAARVFTGTNCTGTVIVYNFGQDSYGNCNNANYYGLFRDYWNASASPCLAPTASSFQVDWHG